MPVGIVIDQSDYLSTGSLGSKHELLAFIGQGRSQDSDFVSKFLHRLDQLLNAGLASWNSDNDDLAGLTLEPQTHALSESRLGVDCRNYNAHIVGAVCGCIG